MEMNVVGDPPEISFILTVTRANGEVEDYHMTGRALMPEETEIITNSTDEGKTK